MAKVNANFRREFWNPQGIAYAFIREGSICKLQYKIPESCDYQMRTLPSGEIKLIIKDEHFNLYPERLEKMSKNINQYIAYYAVREEKGQWSFQFVQTGDSSRANVTVDDDLNGAKNFLIRLRVAAEIIKFPGKLSFAKPLLSYNAAASDPWERFCRDEDSAMQSLNRSD